MRIEIETMASGDSPAVARRRVRHAIREAREAKDLTQGQIAEAMEWSLSKVMRIETGEVTISPNDLRPLLIYLGVGDHDRVEYLVHSAKLSRSRQQWWDQPRYRPYLTPAMRQLIQFEVEATAVLCFAVTLVPGILQTAAYARAVLYKYRDELPDDDIEARFDARLRRRAEFLDRAQPPKIRLLLDESLLLREVGGAEVMGEQLVDLLKRIREQTLTARMVPFAMDAPLPMFGSYDILYLGADEEDAIIYRESYTTDEIVEDPGTIRRHRGYFDQLWDAALDEVTSERLIEDRAKAALASATQRSPG